MKNNKKKIIENFVQLVEKSQLDSQKITDLLNEIHNISKEKEINNNILQKENYKEDKDIFVNIFIYFFLIKYLFYLFRNLKIK